MSSVGVSKGANFSRGSIATEELERQVLREKTIGVRSLERYKNETSRLEYLLNRKVQHLLEDAILGLLLDRLDGQAHTSKTIGDLRAQLRTNKLQPVLEALAQLTKRKRGQPSTFSKFWDLLELPVIENEPHRYAEFGELLFYTTLNEMLVSVLAVQDRGTNGDGDIHGLLNHEDETSQAAGDDPSTEKFDWPWIPERQLYQRVWQAFSINFVSWVLQDQGKLPRWLRVRVPAGEKCDADSAYGALEATLERAFNRASRPTSPDRSRPSLRTGKLLGRAASAKSVDNETVTSEPLPSKSYGEIAEEFSAILVQIVAEITGDDTFVWFQRKQPPRQPRGLASWIPTPILLARIRDLPEFKTTYTVPVNAPLVIPPKRWDASNLASGGYYVRRIGFYKFYQKNSRIHDFLHLCANPEVTAALEVVNALQDTPYRINKKIWQVTQQLLDRVAQLRAGRRGPFLTEAPLDNWVRTSFAAKTLKPKAKAVRECVGDRIRWPLTRGLIEDLASPSEGGASSAFYFAYQADTRGRLYAVSQWLSPQGEDLSRALLEFANGKALTETGAQYLAVHGSQQMRFDRILRDLGINEERALTLEERIEWVHQNRESIVACAERPLESVLWTEAKNPFQFLAFCFAWTEYSRKGTEAICHLPVHVDGVCNGLQHIAALMGDQALGAATNLKPGKPQDIYLLLKQRAVQALESQRKASSYASFALDHDLIDRNLSKSIVMIIPYGAGERGYMKAVRSGLRERMFRSKKSFAEPTPLGEAFVEFIQQHFPGDLERVDDADERRTQPISSHLTGITAVIAEAFIQQLSKRYPVIEDFKRRLRSSASVVWSSGVPMMWQAPSGLPVMQRSFLESRVIVDCRISSATFGTLDLGRHIHADKLKRIKFTSMRLSNEVDEREQASGLLPNFIHSLDSAHLIKTLQLAIAAGLREFSVVHDSYSTHASDIVVADLKLH